MYRVLLQWRGVTISAYPAMLYIGLVSAVMAGTYRAPVHDLDPGRVHLAMLLLLVPALLGARLLFVLCHWQIYRNEPLRIWRCSEGGAALYGGLFASFLFSLPLLSWLEISVAAFWDVAVLAMLIGMVPTKVGCLLNGCCAGQPTKRMFALYLPNEQGVWCRRLPSQLLEATVAVILLIFAIAVWNRFPIDGVVCFTVLAGYGIGRWCLESGRETIDRIGRLSVHKMISASLVIVSMVGLALIWLDRI